VYTHPVVLKPMSAHVVALMSAHVVAFMLGQKYQMTPEYLFV